LTNATAFLLLAEGPFFMRSRRIDSNYPAQKSGGDAHCAAASLSGIKPPVLDH
jgi:hypothetical protein